MSNDQTNLPIDAESAAVLAGRGLRMRLVDFSDPGDFSRWVSAEARGFHGGQPEPEIIEVQRQALGYRRTTGVWDDSAVNAATPVSTVSSWSTPLTVPGHTSVPSWAISAVTVAPTHRRKGIARAMLEAELRTAQALAIPVAILTVSESTIYSRYGFAPAAFAADWSIDTLRMDWTGPVAEGRVQFVTAEQLREQGPDIVERARLNTPGEIEFWDFLWERMVGRHGADKSLQGHLRFVRYDDSDGLAQGFAIYRVTESATDFSANALELKYLAAVTDDAYAGLWRYIFDIDLVGTVTAQLRSIDEPFVWQTSNVRAVSKSREQDHLWIRILDVRAALEARRYAAPGRFVFDVSDSLGYAHGTVLLDIRPDGSASVSAHDGDLPADVAAVSLSVNELSALYLGGVSAVSLARAGRIHELRDGAAAAIDASFRSSVAPWLSIWF
jgi:predicted acetyltransferase